MAADEVRIDPAKVPDYAYDAACSVLAASISKALENPALRAEYEAWKRRDKKGN